MKCEVSQTYIIIMPYAHKHTRDRSSASRVTRAPRCGSPDAEDINSILLRQNPFCSVNMFLTFTLAAMDCLDRILDHIEENWEVKFAGGASYRTQCHLSWMTVLWHVQNLWQCNEKLIVFSQSFHILKVILQHLEFQYSRQKVS